MARITALFHRLKNGLTKLISLLMAVMFYVLGIGLTSLVARLAGKAFLESKYQQSSWVDSKKGGDFRKRY